MTDVATAVTIDPIPENQPGHLYWHYDGQTSPQPTHLVLDLRDGELTADYDPEVGNGHPMSVEHRLVLWFTLPGVYTAAAYNALLEEAKPLAERILAGASIKWDGNNHRGYLTTDTEPTDAEVAEDELTKLCAAFEGREVCEVDAEEWFGEGEDPDITADSTDEDLNRLANKASDEAAEHDPDRYTVLVNPFGHLCDLREELRNGVRDADANGELADQIAEAKDVLRKLEQDRNALMLQMDGWGDTSEDIGNRFGLSSVGAWKAVKKLKLQQAAEEAAGLKLGDD
jgi:hypothetical protein